MAFGTESVPQVNKIVGPGNAFVNEAKRQVFGPVGIDQLAGPSEIFVLADASGDPRLITRPFYYTTITADPTNADVVYVGSEGYYKSTDGGRTFATMPTPHGDNHDLWINPRNPAAMVIGTWKRRQWIQAAPAAIAALTAAMIAARDSPWLLLK